MINEIFIQLITIIGSIISGTISGILTVRLTRPKKLQIESVERREVVKIDYNVTVNSVNSTTKKTESTDSSLFIVLLVLGTFAYVKYNLIFLTLFLGISIFLMTYLIVLNYSVLKKYVYLTREWRSNWFVSFLYAFLIPFFVLLDIYPIWQNVDMEVIFQSSSSVAGPSLDKISNLLNTISRLIYIVSGFFILLLGAYYTFGTLLHMNLIIRRTINPDKSNNWLIKFTKRYSKPHINIWIQIALAFASFILISGLAYNWISKI